MKYYLCQFYLPSKCLADKEILTLSYLLQVLKVGFTMLVLIRLITVCVSLRAADLLTPYETVYYCALARCRGPMFGDVGVRRTTNYLWSMSK